MLSRLIFFIVCAAALAPENSAAQLPPGEGWFAIPNTRIDSVCAGTNGFPQVLGATGCAGITSAWSGGVFDSRRNRLIVFGGGHNDYYGNELYAINLQSATVERLTDPGLPLTAGCSESVANGTQPNSRHTYDGIEYIEDTDEMFVFGGSLACGVGDFGSDTWTYDFQARQWERRNPSGPTPIGDAGAMTAYDPVTGLVFLHDRQYLYSFDSRRNTYTRLSSTNAGYSYYGAATVDPERRLFIVFTGNGISYYSIDEGSSYRQQTLNTSGGGPIVGSSYPGVVYDPTMDRIVGWSASSGNSVYALNVDTRQWSQITYSGGPRAVANGTHGRFRYSAASGVFVLANRVDDNVYILRTSSSAPSVRPNAPDCPHCGTGRMIVSKVVSIVVMMASVLITDIAVAQQSDFDERCAAAGVVNCVGFDNDTRDIVPGQNLYPDGLGTYRASLDTAVKASGDGSLRFDLPPPPHAGANIAGSWSPSNNRGLGQLFGENSTFYVQFRQRFSEGMLNNTWDSSWKSVIFHMNQTTCGGIEITTINRMMTGLLAMYTGCGSPSMFTTLDGSRQTESPPLLLQQGDYNCQYSRENRSDCWYFPADEWVTFYYKISLGNWDQRDSMIELWVARDGATSYEQVIRVPNMPMTCNAANCSGSGEGYNNVTFTPYMTGLGNNSGRSGVTSHMWVDEFIVSTQPIALPGQSSAVRRPNPPESLVAQ